MKKMKTSFERSLESFYDCYWIIVTDKRVIVIENREGEENKFCTCKDPEIANTPTSDAFCSKCGKRVNETI